MDVVIIYRFMLANALTFCYSAITLIILLLNYLKNPFKTSSLRLVPPAPLTDPKYGVHKYIKANNTILHYVDSGDPAKPLMLFLHGFPEFWYMWRHQIVYYNNKYRCVAVDMRGYGDSERPDPTSCYKLDLLMEDIRDLIKQLGHEKCILVAHDFGGMVACRLRDVYPDMLSALIMLDSSEHNLWIDLMYNSAEQMKKSWYVFLFRMPWIPERMLQINDLEVFDKTIFDGRGVTKQDIECFKYWFSKNTALTPPINYYRANFQYTTKLNYHSDNVPFLFAHGSNEKYLSRVILDRMKEQYAVIETAIVEDAGHFMPQSEPEKTNELIDRFLKKHDL